MATTAMLNAANGTPGSVDPPAPTSPAPAPALAPAPAPAAAAAAPTGPSMMNRASGMAKRFGATWVFKYVVLLVLVVVILLVVRPGFVMDKTTPTPEDPTVGQTYSWKAIVGVAVATVAAAVLIPLAYENRAKIVGGVSSFGKTVKSAVLQ